MNSFIHKRFVLLVSLLAFQLFCAATIAWSQGQNPAHTKTAGVDNTRMGAYRALAELACEASTKGDNPAAAKLARILERTWDRGEEGDGDNALERRNPELFKQVDALMDSFIKPLIAYEKQPPDHDKVNAAFKEFINGLKLAE